MNFIRYHDLRCLISTIINNGKGIRMEHSLIYSSLVFLISIMIFLHFRSKNWNDTRMNFLFANRSLRVLESGAAISSHWFWAIAIFVGPMIAYKWGIIGLLWFSIPNALSLVIVGFITHKIREKYENGFSLTQYIKEKFDRKFSALFQLEFVLVSFAALLLAFTAISKLWGVTGLSPVIEPIYFSLAVGIITLYFTLMGGIRTSIFTGSLQTVLWLLFLSVMIATVFFNDYSIISYGTNNLTEIFRVDFISSFAVTWTISILVGASAHGMMWQKSFSMPKNNIIPSYFIASLIFLIICLSLSTLGMIAFSNGFSVSSPDTSQLTSVYNILGPIGVTVIGILIIGQTSTVIDSSLNYLASLVSGEWFKKDSVNFSRFTMIFFLILAWAVSWLKLEIWTILLLMSAVRIVMFVPLVAHVLEKNVFNKTYFYILIGSILISFSSFVCARMFSIPNLEMLSAIFAITFPSLALLLLQKSKNV